MSKISMLRISLFFPVSLLCFASLAFGDERVPVGHRCAEDDQGNVVCSKFGGGDAFADHTNKQVVCGRGHCQIDYYKKAAVSCAKTEDGVATYDRQGRVVCSGGCELASPEKCEKLQP
jgi:hypothetical protein